ncbi:MAG TPA: hypothetical protein VHB49_04920 [Bradyrhizobium sp.]|nr:hypothetical protein [Bradyrhizobium sp.]
MKSHKGNMVLFGRFSFLSASWSGSLRAAAIAMFLVGLQLNPSAAHPGSAQIGPARAHVFLIRGVLNIFSLGMDQMASELQQQGITATVHNHLFWASIADEAAAEYKSGRINTVILVGHSSGATVLPDIVARLDHEGVPVKLAVGLDSVFHTSLSGRVGRYINYYVGNGAGTRVAEAKGFSGKLENVDVESIPGISHLTIDKNALIQQKVIAEIDAAVRSGPGPVRVVRKPRPVVAVPRSSASHSAAAN